MRQVFLLIGNSSISLRLYAFLKISYVLKTKQKLKKKKQIKQKEWSQQNDIQILLKQLIVKLYQFDQLFTFQYQLFKKMMRSSEPVQFINNLQLMMQHNSDIIGWDASEKYVLITNRQKLQTYVLGKYFKTKYYRSFVRQLNNYNFHKICLQNNKIHFKNDLFFKGNEQNFYKIETKKKSYKFIHNPKPIEEQINLIQSHPRLILPFKNIIIKLLEYKSEVIKHNSKVKQFLDSLKDKKFKKYQKDISKIKQQLGNIYDSSQKTNEYNNSQKIVQCNYSQSIQKNRLDDVLYNDLMTYTIQQYFNNDQNQQEIDIPVFLTQMSLLKAGNKNNEEDNISLCSIKENIDQ